MSTLLELQRQLRRVTEEYHEQMLALTRELTMAVQDVEAGQKQMDFQRLSKLGERCPLLHRGLQRVDDTLRNDYLTFLCAVAQSAPEMGNGWLLLQRIACGVGVTSLEPLAARAMCLEEGDMERFSHNICQKNLRDHFLLDAMLLRMACTQPCPNTEALLVNLSALMECPVKELRVLSKLAAVLARQDGSAYLSMGLELGERDWLGLEYIQKNADILYTDQFSEARKHGFHSVILHDCTIKKEDIPDDCIEMTECCLLHCRFTDSTTVALTHSTATGCEFRFPMSNSLGIIIRGVTGFESSTGTYFGRKMQLNHSTIQNCLVVCVEKGEPTDFFELNDTVCTEVNIQHGVQLGDAD